MKQSHLGLSVLLACTIMLAGCGGGAPQGVSEAAPEQAPSSEGATEAPAAQESKPEPIAEPEEFFVIQDAEYVNGNLKSVTVTEYDDAMHPVKRTVNGALGHEWTYDGDLLVEEIDYNSDLRFIYTYEGGVLVHEEQVGLDGSPWKTIDYENDLQGNPLVEHWYNATGEHTGDITYAYGSDGSFSRTHPYADAPDEYYTQRYDAEGRLIDNGQGTVWDYGEDRTVKTVTDASGNRCVVTYEYTRDADGNVIHTDYSDFFDIGGTQTVYTIDNEYENGKRVYSRQENSLLGGFEDHDVEEHYYLYRGTAGTVFGRDETGAAV